MMGLVLIPTRSVRADMAPKPSMDFEFVYEATSEFKITSGDLMVCEDATCGQASLLEELDPYTHFRCDLESCSSHSYGYPDKQFYLIITFSDGETRESNLFGKEHYQAYYQVTVREDTLVVEEIGGYDDSAWFFALMGFFLGIISLIGGILGGIIISVIIVAKDWKKGDIWGGVKLVWLITAWVIGILLLVSGGFFLLAIPLTAVIELTLGWLYSRWRERPKRVVLTMILVANLVTLLGLSIIPWTGPIFSFSWTDILIMEGLIWLVEAVILFLPLRKSIRFSEALLLSLALNAVSFGVGLLLPF
jgi:hypothetical protein